MRQPRQRQAVLIEYPHWQRIKSRIRKPRPSAIWLTLAGILGGVALDRHDESAVPFAAGAALCFLADRAVNKSERESREDIAREMELHEAEPHSRRRRSAATLDRGGR